MNIDFEKFIFASCPTRTPCPSNLFKGAPCDHGGFKNVTAARQIERISYCGQNTDDRLIKNDFRH